MTGSISYTKKCQISCTIQLCIKYQISCAIQLCIKYQISCDIQLCIKYQISCAIQLCIKYQISCAIQLCLKHHLHASHAHAVHTAFHIVAIAVEIRTIYLKNKSDQLLKSVALQCTYIHI